MKITITKEEIGNIVHEHYKGIMQIKDDQTLLVQFERYDNELILEVVNKSPDKEVNEEA